MAVNAELAAAQAVVRNALDASRVQGLKDIWTALYQERQLICRLDSECDAMFNDWYYGELQLIDYTPMFMLINWTPLRTMSRYITNCSDVQQRRSHIALAITRKYGRRTSPIGRDLDRLLAAYYAWDTTSIPGDEDSLYERIDRFVRDGLATPFLVASA
jgi:hypothetical protein